jgi:hypothetical protein
MRRRLDQGPKTIDEVDRRDVNSMFRWLSTHAATTGLPWRPQYAWPILRSAMTAKALGIQRISVIEFGVAGGNGLVAMESAAEAAESLLGVGVEVFGFDTGAGLPKPVDHRDAPFALGTGDFRMDVEKLQARLGRAQLFLGPVRETVHEFLGQAHPPVGFISNDLDYYSSTVESFALLEAGSDRLIPRVHCYFDDIMWWPWTEFTGERAAINDFNASHDQRKLSPAYGLRYSLPRSELREQWPDMIYIAELFDHDQYNAPEGEPLPDVSLED